MCACLDLYQLSTNPAAPSGSPCTDSGCLPRPQQKGQVNPKSQRCAGGACRTRPAPAAHARALPRRDEWRRAFPTRRPALRLPRGRGLGGRGRAAGYLRADHVELAVVLQLELDGLLPEGLAQRHHHHCGGGGRQPKPGCEGSGGLRRGCDAPSQGSRSWEVKAVLGQVLVPPPGPSAAAATTTRPPSVRMRGR